MKGTLLAITTANQFDYTKRCLESISDTDKEEVDIIIVDDASTDETVNYAEKACKLVIKKDKPLGLTNSWNLAYQFFKKNNYKNLILSNNDVLIPEGSIIKLIDALENNIIVAPLSNSTGVKLYPKQNVDKYYNFSLDANDHSNFEKIQQQIDEQSDGKVIYSEIVNGYFFGVNELIKDYEYDTNLLFNPTNINIGNEDELFGRVKEQKAIITSVFVFHFKGISFKDFILEDNSILSRNLNWKEAKKYQKHFLFRIFIKIKYKLLKIFN